MSAGDSILSDTGRKLSSLHDIEYRKIAIIQLVAAPGKLTNELDCFEMRAYTKHTGSD